MTNRQIFRITQEIAAIFAACSGLDPRLTIAACALHATLVYLSRYDR